MIIHVLGRSLSGARAEKSLTSGMVFSMKTLIRGRRSFEEGMLILGELCIKCTEVLY